MGAGIGSSCLKRGYVGLWQWTFDFIAMGVAHGDPDLALEQFEIAMLSRAMTDNFRMSSTRAGCWPHPDDLPPADRLKLEAEGSASIGLGAVPSRSPR